MAPTPAIVLVPVWLTNNFTVIAAGVIVALGLGVFGLKDLLRFRPRRVWAISSVCFAESIRRRVLWLIPLAILGLVAVVQLQQPLDEQDSIRQTTKFCLLTAALVVVVATVVLACTNLPREIDNKVIFTVVTKPTTRLEVVLGKIVGFSRLSATILIIMGLFSYGYLHLRASLLESDLRRRLDAGQIDPVSVSTSRYYVDNHLLNARQFAPADGLSIYGEPPVPDATKRYPAPEGMILVPFVIPDNAMALADPEGTANFVGLWTYIHLGYEELKDVKPDRNGEVKPCALVQVLDNNFTIAVPDLNKNMPFPIEDPSGQKPIKFALSPQFVCQVAKPDQTARENGLDVRVPFWIAIQPKSSANYRIFIDQNPQLPPVQMSVAVQPKNAGDPITAESLGPWTRHKDDPSTSSTRFSAREGQLGQQVKGDSPEIGIYKFGSRSDGIPITADGAGNAQFEFRVGIEKNSENGSADALTRAELTFVNAKSGYRSPPVVVTPENNRPCYGSVPIAAVQGGDFDVEVRCLSPNQWLNVAPRSLKIVQSQSYFGYNLFLSLLILWLLSVLVTTVSVFSSTFLSWPIAIVLTLVILLTRWLLAELGDAAAAGLGRSIMTEFQITDPTVAQSLSKIVDSLNHVTTIISTVLPDITQFSATDQIEQGLVISTRAIGSALLVTAEFGLPLMVLAYVIFRRKEVAP